MSLLSEFIQWFDEEYEYIFISTIIFSCVWSIAGVSAYATELLHPTMELLFGKVLPFLIGWSILGAVSVLLATLIIFAIDRSEGAKKIER